MFEKLLKLLGLKLHNIDSIVADLVKKVQKLDAACAYHADQVKVHNQAADEAIRLANDSGTQARRAERLKAKIQELIA